MTITLEVLVACVDRELKMRAKVYPRWVRQGKFSQEQADKEMARMLEVRKALIRGEAAALVCKALTTIAKLNQSHVDRMMAEAMTGLGMSLPPGGDEARARVEAIRAEIKRREK